MIHVNVGQFRQNWNILSKMVCYKTLHSDMIDGYIKHILISVGAHKKCQINLVLLLGMLICQLDKPCLLALCMENVSHKTVKDSVPPSQSWSTIF